MKTLTYIPPVCETVELMMGNLVLIGSETQKQQIAPVWEDDYDEF